MKKLANWDLKYFAKNWFHFFFSQEKLENILKEIFKIGEASNGRPRIDLKIMKRELLRLSFFSKRESKNLRWS